MTTRFGPQLYSGKAVYGVSNPVISGGFNVVVDPINSTSTIGLASVLFSAPTPPPPPPAPAPAPVSGFAKIGLTQTGQLVVILM